MKSNHGGVQGKLPAGLTEVGVEQGSSTHRRHSGEEAEEENEERGNNDDMRNEEEDEGVNEHYYEFKAEFLICELHITLCCILCSFHTFVAKIVSFCMMRNSYLIP
jgi:hypothetical protein